MRPGRGVALLLAAPLTLILLAGVVLPTAIVVAYSFFTVRLRRVQPGFTLDAYRTAVTESAYQTFAVNTLAIAAPVALLATVGGFLLAHHLVHTAGRRRNVWLALVAVSLLGSYLARIYAWRTVLGGNGLVNGALLAAGLIDEPIEALLFSRFAVIVAEVNLLLPLVCLLIFAGLSGTGEHVRDAARDLGAGRVEVLRRVTLPLAGPAVLSALSFAFFLSAGDFITPALLGGTDSTTIGVAVADQLRVTGNYPLGSALGVVTMIGFGLTYLIIRTVFRLAGWLPGRAQVDA